VIEDETDLLRPEKLMGTIIAPSLASAREATAKP
jgi:hypothetical protein